jgi:hypothetical protein
VNVLFVLAAVCVGGCDGHVQVLCLRPPGAGKPAWTVALTVIDIRGDEDVVGTVSAVAGELGMVRDSEAPDRWYLPEGGERVSRFWMSVRRAEKGYWEVTLEDWPESMRSEVSKRAERGIRGRLGQCAVCHARRGARV